LAKSKQDRFHHHEALRDRRHKLIDLGYSGQRAFVVSEKQSRLLDGDENELRLAGIDVALDQPVCCRGRLGLCNYRQAFGYERKAVCQFISETLPKPSSPQHMWQCREPKNR
jgi:hypothetical protein